MSKYIETCDAGAKSSRVALGALAIAAAVGLVAATAHAEPVVSGTNTVPQFFVFGAPQPVDINGGAAGTTLAIPACAAGNQIMITFSSVCSHNGAVFQWGSIQILLNGVPLSPTAGGADQFCSGNETVGVHDGWATQSMEVVGRCGDGADVVAVTAQSAFAGTTLRLDDMSTVVDP